MAIHSLYKGIGREAVSARYAVAEEMESTLGDPSLAENTFSYSSALELDEQEEMPTEAIDLLRQLGFRRYFVPVAHGGKLASCEELMMLTRVVARRDMNVAVSESTQLWMMLMWIGGDAEQCRHASASVLRGEVIPCLAYSEAEHGGDLAANDFIAAPNRDEYILSGKKWPINRAITSTHVVLLGRTGGSDSRSARRAQSLFIVEKDAVRSGAINYLSRVATHGLRGCDISGVSFDCAKIPGSMRIGAEGEGLELALRGLLVTRSMCTGLSLGVGDTMLRVVSEFLSNRTLYGGPSSEIPYVTDALANSYLNLLIAECASIVAMRGLHLYADEFSTWANLAKVGVARLVDYNAKVLARALGARYYMRDLENQGIFQKMFRDGAIVSVFDGSEPVCLDSIALQLSAMAKARLKARDDDWSQLYDVRQQLREFDPTRVTVFGRGRDAVFASLPALRARLDATRPSARRGSEQLAELRALVAQLEADVEDLFEAVRHTAPRLDGGGSTVSSKTTSPRLIRLADRCCDLHAKVAALGVWLFNYDHLDDFFAEGSWLAAALARTRGYQFELGDLTPATTARLADRLHSQRLGHQFFSILPLRQAASGSREVLPAPWYAVA